MKSLAKVLLPGLLTILAGCGGSDPSAPVSRVVIVGIESFSREHALSMIGKGELPNLARLLREGAQARVISPDPLLSPMLWSTLLTGQDAQQHLMSTEYVGIDQGVLIAPSSMRVVPSIFQIASANKLLVASIGFPGTWPAEVLSGFNLSYGAIPSRLTEASEHTFARDPRDRASFPESLREDALALYTPVERMDRSETSPFFVLNESEFEMLYDRPLGSIYRRENPLADFAISLMRDRAQVALTARLLEEYPVRLAGVHLDLAEALQLPYWRAAYPDRYELPANSVRRYGKTIDACYRELDAALGKLIGAAGEDAVICVVGDRGFGNVVNPDPETGEDRMLPAVSNESLLVLSGHGIGRGKDLGAVNLVDITPTLLTAMDLPVGQTMKGRVLEGAFTPEFLAAHPRRPTETYTEAFMINRERYPSQLGGGE